MAYEYSSASRRLDVPNPLRSENLFLFAASFCLAGAALFLLLQSRAAIGSGQGRLATLPLLVGVFLLLRAIVVAGGGLRQLRFFFGRGQPRGLAAELAPEQSGISNAGKALRETLRQNALTYAEPQGALNGLLYSWLPDLIFAPPPIQWVAQRQFQTALTLIATLISWAMSQVTLNDSQASAWAGLFYLLFASALIIRPLEAGAHARAQVGIRGLVLLILIAIFGPVLIPQVSGSLPDIRWLALDLQAAVLMLTALAATGLFFLALTRQLIAPPPTTMAREQAALSFNAHPKQLIDELDRLLQSNWTEQIPNRRYAFTPPQIEGGAGTFRAELIEETQPLPVAELDGYSLGQTLRSERHRWLVWTDAAGLLLTVAGTLAWVGFALDFAPGVQGRQALFWASLAVALLVVARFCFRAAHALWQRFDFASEIIWVEMQGSYQAADFQVGAEFTDRIKSRRQVINVETMTLRVWVAQLDTVIFGKNAQRWLIGMRGLADRARALAAHLSDFAGAQSIVVAPTAAADVQKVAAMGAMNKLALDHAGPQALPAAMAKSLAAAVQQYCHQCGSANETSARFCGQCGTGLTEPA